MFHDILYKLKKINERRAVILMYHQVCERNNDPWELAVYPKHFQAQLKYLKENFHVVPMTDLAEGIARHAVKKSIAITFDDGFKDNYSNAAPVLDWLQIPATFYVSTTAVRDEKLYWWDVLQHMIFCSEKLPRDFEMVINGEIMQFNFQSDHVLTSRLMNQIRAWNYNLPIPNERIALYMQLWYAIKPLRYARQHEVLGLIGDWAGCKDFSYPEAMTMNVREMQVLGQHPLFSIGAHSVHHSMLSQQSSVDQAYELKESKRQIETWLRKSIDGFSYPYGNYNALTQQLIKEAGFRYAVSTESKPVTSQDDPFSLPRIQVKNWSVYEFASILNKMINE